MVFGRRSLSGAAPRIKKTALPCRTVFFAAAAGLIFEDGKIILADTALRALPIVGNILERRAGSDSTVGIADFRIVDPATYVTEIFLHSILLG